MPKHVPIQSFDDKEKARFWAKVDKSGGPDACWIWKAGTKKGGYGKFRRNRPRMLVISSRAAFAMTYGDPGENMVCHRCDNPPCCNPKHFFLGDAASNAADMISKGRQPRTDTRGSKNGRAKLNERDIEQIIRLVLQGMTNKEIGYYFGVTHSMISVIRLGKAWRLQPSTKKYASLAVVAQ